MADGQLKKFSDRDLAVLREMIRDKESRQINWRPGSTNQSEERNFQTPELYVARPLTDDGIPPLQRVFGGPDFPGVADCEVYRILDDPDDTGTGSQPMLVKVDGVAVQLVYNIAETRIPQTWITIERTKYGKWLAQPGWSVAEDIFDTGTGTGSACWTIPGIDFGNLNIVGDEPGTGTFDDPEYVLGIDKNGCLVRIPVSSC